MKFKMTKKIEKNAWNLFAKLILKNPKNLENLTNKSDNDLEVNN